MYKRRRYTPPLTGRKALSLRQPRTYAIVNEVAGYAYVGIMKAGSTSIRVAIAQQAGVTLEDLRSVQVAARNVAVELFRFTVVRNPFARLVSCWAHFASGAQAGKLRSNFEFAPLAGMSFREFAVYVCRRQWATNMHYAPQWHQLHHDGRRLVDSIIKLEEIDREWPALMEQWGLPALSVRRASQHDPWESYYTRGLKRSVARKYRADFERLGYQKG